MLRDEGLRTNVKIMKGHCLLFVNPCTLIGIILEFFKFTKLQFLVKASQLHIKVELLDGPHSLVLNFHKKMAFFFINKPAR